MLKIRYWIAFFSWGSFSESITRISGMGDAR